MFEKWEKFKIIRNVVNAAIEVKRSSKDIGSSLEADVEIYLNEDYFKVIKDFDLAENFITSKAIAKKFVKDNSDFFKLGDIENINVLVKKAAGKKCPRCWKILPESCKRCATSN